MITAMNSEPSVLSGSQLTATVKMGVLSVRSGDDIRLLRGTIGEHLPLEGQGQCR